MKVVVDANILISDPWMAGTQFGTLLDGLRQVGGRLVVPEIVIEEAVNKYRERYGEALSAARSKWEKLTHLGGQEAVFPQQPTADKAARDYREWLLGRLRDIEAEMPPFPELSHKKVVTRELQRKKPFSNGRGYRDYLVWHSVLSVNGQVIMVSQDQDFRDGQDLHPDLEEDLRRTPHLRDSFALERSLADFNEKFILPQLKQLEDVRKRLEAEGPGSVDIVAWIRENLDQFLVEEDLLVAGLGLPPDAGSASRPRLTGPPVLSIEKVWEREPEKFLVRARVELPLCFDVDFDHEDAVRYRDVQRLVGEYLPPGGSASWKEENIFEVDFLFTLGGDPPALLDWDVEMVDAQLLWIPEGDGGES